ncbi:hypothetical protein T439DRAFT_376567 [Meredithblackwellia eburnea MCA 4105]
MHLSIPVSLLWFATSSAIATFVSPPSPQFALFPPTRVPHTLGTVSRAGLPDSFFTKLDVRIDLNADCEADCHSFSMGLSACAAPKASEICHCEATFVKSVETCARCLSENKNTDLMNDYLDFAELCPLPPQSSAPIDKTFSNEPRPQKYTLTSRGASSLAARPDLTLWILLTVTVAFVPLLHVLQFAELLAY